MKIILLLIIAIGVTLIYDARKISSEYFSKQDQNKITIILKLLGFALAIFCGFIIAIVVKI